MFDSYTVYLERLGTWCGHYRLEKVLRHDRIRTSYLGVGPEEQLFEIQIFEESQYVSRTVHEAIESYIKALRTNPVPGTLRIVDAGYASDD